MFQLLDVLNDHLFLICVYDASWYFHKMHFGASGVVSNGHTDFHLEIVQPLAPTTWSHRSQSSFVWSFQVWSGRLGKMAILDAQGNGINNLADSVNFFKGSCIFWSTVPSGLVCKCAYLLGKIRKRTAWNCAAIFVIQTYIYNSQGGKKMDVWVTWSFFIRCPTGLF